MLSRLVWLFALLPMPSSRRLGLRRQHVLCSPTFGESLAHDVQGFADLFQKESGQCIADSRVGARYHCCRHRMTR